MCVCVCRGERERAVVVSENSASRFSCGCAGCGSVHRIYLELVSCVQWSDAAFSGMIFRFIFRVYYSVFEYWMMFRVYAHLLFFFRDLGKIKSRLFGAKSIYTVPAQYNIHVNYI